MIAIELYTEDNDDERLRLHFAHTHSLNDWWSFARTFIRSLARNR